MTIPKLSKNTILLIALVVVAAIGIYLFMGKSSPDPSLTSTETGALTGTVGQELVSELNRLRALQNIRGDFLTDPAFESLNDYTQVVVTQPRGRSNPFAPIGQ